MYASALFRIPILPPLTELAAAKNMTYTLCGWPTSDDTHVFPVTNIVGIVVAIISVALRLTSRALDKRLGWDDLLIFIALVIDRDGINGTSANATSAFCCLNFRHWT